MPALSMEANQKRSITWLLSATLICSLLVQLSAQQFYPNGRYGRRSMVPPLADAMHEISVSFFGDGSVSCIYTGVSNFYRCNKKSSGASNESMD
ncbi:RYamide neuropeptides-like [Centruroides vittatus]|uniref:RYamide neuropeptides-like n=1 Tax=Centruroides vittatus TaxID=120091 RepID=UPI00351016F8